MPSTTNDSTADLPRVRVVRFEPDFEDPGGTVIRRVLQLVDFPACLFLNPLATVSCALETSEFQAVIERYRRRWCRLAKMQFHQRACRSVSSWAERKPDLSPSEAAMDFLFGFKGALYINGKLSKKPMHVQHDYRRRSRPIG